MVNKKIVGIVLGIVTIVTVISTVAASVITACQYAKVKKRISCDRCKSKNECKCNGKYFYACSGVNCIVEEADGLSEEDFEKCKGNSTES